MGPATSPVLSPESTWPEAESRISTLWSTSFQGKRPAPPGPGLDRSEGLAPGSIHQEPTQGRRSGRSRKAPSTILPRSPNRKLAPRSLETPGTTRRCRSRLRNPSERDQRRCGHHRVRPRDRSPRESLGPKRVRDQLNQAPASHRPRGRAGEPAMRSMMQSASGPALTLPSLTTSDAPFPAYRTTHSSGASSRSEDELSLGGWRGTAISRLLSSVNCSASQIWRVSG